MQVTPPGQLSGTSRGVVFVLVATIEGGNRLNIVTAATPAPTFEPLLTVEEAAKLLGGIHPKTLQRRARNGEIPGYQISRSWFFRASELDTWVRSLVRSNTASSTREN